MTFNIKDKESLTYHHSSRMSVTETIRHVPTAKSGERTFILISTLSYIQKP